MTLAFSDITAGKRLAGVVTDGDVSVVAIEMHGPSSATLTYRSATGQLNERIVTEADLAKLSEVSEKRWSFDADGEMFRLASEARRMKWAHLTDRFAAVDTSNIDPYPHQIDAVYNRLLTQKPLKFLLADDPGAGKTVMSGLLIRELMLRGDVARCLIVAPGSLVEQWQDELWDKFSLDFKLMSRSAIEDSRTGNPFLDNNLLVARLDQLSRAEDLTPKLKVSDWDLVIVDEAHKMSAHRYDNELQKTKRFILGEALRDRTRHFLLLTATPHNGKNEDFLAFMTLIDLERFTGQLRDKKMPDVSDVMRRLVKENLLTFDGKRLFPERRADTLNFELSDLETELYEAVTDYVRTGMNRAERMQEEGDKRRGLIVGFALAGLQRRLASSPAAIYHSLRRRCERLAKQAEELRRLASVNGRIPMADLPKGVGLSDLEDLDYDDYDDEELEGLENFFIDAATAAATADELDAEVSELQALIGLADRVRNSGIDTKWAELRKLLRSDHFKKDKSSKKLIVFSEHKDTLDYVAGRVSEELGRSEAVVTIHGGIKRHDRREIQGRFCTDPTVQVLVATDAASEGVNLQVANMMVNYDLPWNPNRIEQRFGRIHRIGQKLPCHLWNLVAYQTREGQVFERLFEKIKQQSDTYGDQVYDVLGDSHINTSLKELLIRAIREDADPARLSYMDEIIDGEIGTQLENVLRERALVGALANQTGNEDIRNEMELSRARKLQPWFVEAFFSAALKQCGGRIVARERGRYEVTRVPAAVRAHADGRLGSVYDRYERVTFDKAHVQVSDGKPAMLISPGTPLLAAVVEKVLADHGHTLQRGATLVDPDDESTEPRLLIYFDHIITDGHRQVVSHQFHYAEINRQGHATISGNEPYIGYSPLTEDQRKLINSHLNTDWADQAAETVARDWAIERLAGPHFVEVEAITNARVDKTREAVHERLEAEIRSLDKEAEQAKAQELAGKKPKISFTWARTQADNLEARLERRRIELDMESNLQNSPPTIVAAAIVVPQGLLNQLAGTPTDPQEVTDKMETDRRAVAAVVEVERKLGRDPEVQSHNNPGFDILSVDPSTGIHYFIEVKGHLPQTTEISVSAQQVQKAKSNPERWRLAVVSVPSEPDAQPDIHYLVEPFRDVTLHFAQTKVPMEVSSLLQDAGEPR